MSRRSYVVRGAATGGNPQQTNHQPRMSDYLRLVYRRALTQSDPALLQLSFDAGVLDRYRESGAYSVIRTDTVGRVKKQGGWTLDFGIAPDERSIHASWQALSTVLPEDERARWASHAVETAALSEMFLRMQLAPAACHDDGEVRAW